MEDPFVVGSVSLRLTCSFGVAKFRPELSRLESLLNLADQALYAAKANGRDRVETADTLASPAFGMVPSME
jgi:diguanylate cyclase (GGDEF)-like protein